MKTEAPQVVSYDAGFLPRADVPSPALLQTEDSAFLVFRADTGTGVVEILGCLISKFGYPNDEALGGHPLYSRGLSCYGIFEVLDSPWIHQLHEQNRTTFPNSSSGGRHYVFTFHDSTFECIADGLSTSVTREPYAQVLASLSQRFSKSPNDG